MMKRFLALLCSLAVLPLLGTADETSKEPGPSASSKALAAIVEEYETYQLERNPGARIQRSLDVTRLPDFSYEAEQKDAAFSRALRERLARVDAAGLTHEEWLTREILDWQLGLSVEGLEHVRTIFQITPYNAPFRGQLHEVFTSFTFDDEKDLDRYLDLLRQYAVAIGQLRANLEAQRGNDVLLPKAEIEPVVGLVRSFIRSPEESLFEVASSRLSKIDAQRAKAFQTEVRQLVESAVNPALEKLAAVPDLPEYRKAAPDRVGLGQYMGGQEAYRYLVRAYTSLNVTPEEVHQRGLEEIARLNTRLEEIRKKVGFAGSLEEFRGFLKTDPRFFVKTPEEVAERLMAPIRRLEPRVEDFFLRMPKAPYGVARLEPELEGTITYGYYRQPTPARNRGDYMFNGSQLDARSMLSAAALIFHELVPGHHFQISLQLENDELPELRKNSYPTAFVEGYAMYASGLAEEMGGYADLYEIAGWIANDLFLSSRLVVDTGMNALGWPRQRAIDYMQANTFESSTQIGTETLRYSADIPGQALAYKMGSNKIWELRRKAEKELGKKFDIRRFHETVIGSGAMPMTVLEKHVEWWIGEERKR
jgi:uncharacterized protein (DUF885 family)